MARITALFIMILLSGYALADIILQPGYENKAQSQRPANLIAQPPETLGRAGHGNSLDPGYHIELYPVYSGPYQIPAAAMAPWLQSQYTTNTNYKRLTPGINTLQHQTVPYEQFVPLPVRNRSRRSSGREESVLSNERKKRDDDVAKKSSLNDQTLSVIDLPGQEASEDKRVNTRQSSGTLLGLNPSNMYTTMYQPYHATEMDPSHTSHQEIEDQQKLSQINARTIKLGRKLGQAESPTSVRLNIPQLAQHPTPKLQQLPISEYRNAPDPRPIPTTPLNTVNQPYLQSMAQNSPIVQPDSEMAEDVVGNPHNKVKVHLHQHTVVKGVGQSSSDSIVKYDGIPPSSPITQPIVQPTDQQQQVIQIYQVPVIQEGYRTAPIQYIVPSIESCTDNYVANYIPNYSYYSLVYYPMRVCTQTLASLSPIVY